MSKKFLKVFFLMSFIFILSSCQKKSFTITYEVDGTIYGEIETYSYNSAITIRDNPTKDGHTFSGWDKQLPKTMPQKNILIKGSFNKNTYTIKFYDGETLIQTLNVLYNELPNPTTPEKTDFSFNGWTPNLEVATKDQSYYANFEALGDYYNITFNVLGELEVVRYLEGQVIKYHVPTKDNYVFDGWYLDSDYKELNSIYTMPANNLTLYAKFKLAPGYKGSVISLFNTATEGMFPGFIVYKVDQNRNLFGGTYSSVELHFPEPSEIDATYYTVEYYNEVTDKFEPFVYNGETLTANYNNLALSLNEPYTFRLHAITSDNKHYYSNIVNTITTGIKTSFAGYSLDQSYYIGGVMMPYVGYGLEFDTVIYDISESENVLIEEGYTYKWYRLNPYTYELFLIEEENESIYITKEEDIGYYIVARVVGDGISVGGYLQVISLSTVKKQVEVIDFIQTDNGIIISFDYCVEIKDSSFFTIYDQDYNELEIDEIEVRDLGGSYYLKIDLTDVEYLYIYLEEASYVLGSLVIEQHFMHGFEVELLVP